MKILLISTYELGHQPVSLAHPAAILRAEGFDVEMLDLSLERLEPGVFGDIFLVALSIPMHTAARLTVPLLSRIRDWKADLHIAAYGLYAIMNRDYFTSLGVDSVLGREFESDLLVLAKKFADLEIENAEDKAKESEESGRIFQVPDRSGLPSLDRYAHVRLANGQRKTVGYVEATRGCKHFCRHCPIVPVYQGKFRAIPREIVLADIRQQVASGARHITFGDPDFLNGPSHARRLIEALHREFPELTYDATIKVEHILAHRSLLPILKETGCLFITSAIESVNDLILERLAKGHCREDFFLLMELFDENELDLSPTFVPFTPWTTLEDYIDQLEVIAGLGLIDSVAPVQYSIRLLIPPGSRLLELDEVKSLVGPLEAESFLYPWENPDPRIDRLHAEVRKIVQGCSERTREQFFTQIWKIAHETADIEAPALPACHRDKVPAQLSEPWYCCAEPNENQFSC